MKPVTPGDLELSADPEETAESHEAIAVEKAVEWSRLAGMLAIASDGGLVVPSLGTTGKADTHTGLPDRRQMIVSAGGACSNCWKMLTEANERPAGWKPWQSPGRAGH